MTDRRLHSVGDDAAADLEAQDAALDVACPLCAAPRDAYCTNPLTGTHLHNRISHWQRLTAATTKDQT